MFNKPLFAGSNGIDANIIPDTPSHHSLPADFSLSTRASLKCGTRRSLGLQVTCCEPATAPHEAIYSTASRGKKDSRAGQQ